VTDAERFLIDESADARVAPYLRGRGHDVALVATDYGPALEDAEVLAISVRDGRILITFDRDFGELVYSQGQPHGGVLYFRLGPIDLDLEIVRLDYVLTHYADRLNHFLTITPRSVRVRQ
jgi:predicted nuclease of predicted toxin-antitoxin system